MNRSTRFLTATLALVGGLAAVGAAQASENVQWSVTIGSDAPIYTVPVTPVYRVPPPVYQAPMVAQYQYRQPQYRQPTRWDRDGDGIPNRYDRLYNPAWDRDGDGVPNRYDRHDDYRRWGRGH